MRFDLSNFTESLLSGLRYLPYTLKLVFLPLALGLVFGTIIALIRVYKVPVLDKLLALFVTVYQGIPIVVALMIYNLLFILKFNTIASALHIHKSIKDVDTIWVGIFALSLMVICSMSEVIRGALLSVDPGQDEAGSSVGLTKVQTIRRIILPQMLSVAIPSLINNIVGLIKGSSIAMTIGIAEVLTGALIPCSRTYTFFEGYVAAALIYWVFTIFIEYLAGVCENHIGRYRRKIS